MSPIEKGHKRDQFNHTMIKVLGSTSTMAPISIKGLRFKDPLLHECDFYKPLEAEPLATISEKNVKNFV